MGTEGGDPPNGSRERMDEPRRSRAGTRAPEEDTSGGFEHGGWHMRYFDEGSKNWVLGQLTEAGGFLLGRRTYEILAGYWPNATEEEQVVATSEYEAEIRRVDNPQRAAGVGQLFGAEGRSRRSLAGAEEGEWRRPARDWKRAIGPYAHRAQAGG